jgi:hypothetical protein
VCEEGKGRGMTTEWIKKRKSNRMSVYEREREKGEGIYVTNENLTNIPLFI